ncbi:hypothetical protein HFO26_28955 [Rhizobium leguminosarum]|nr:hypothetical protein [Rhizobium leguminosarum]MBY5734283.1 hypothetical protein [Rhizobium leguminosarum]
MRFRLLRCAHDIERAIEGAGVTQEDNLVCVQLAASGRMKAGSGKIA